MSPYVTAVGGTTLALDQNGNRIAEESAWLDGGSGYALEAWYERPSYQNGIPYYLPDPNYPIAMTAITADENVRAIPDVSYNADPATPFAIYTTTPINGDRGWFAVGGTSAGAPQWAALIALENQKRQAAKLGVIGNKLNGMLYDIYNGYAEDGGANQSYANTFNDVIVGQAGPWFAEIGYDMATGIGTPQAANLLNTLTNYSPFMIQQNFSFDSHLYFPYSLASAGLMPVAVGQEHTGTGSILGTDSLTLMFLTDPVKFYGPNYTSVTVPDRYYDTSLGEESAFRVTLHRTGRGQTSGRIYGMGTADIYNADPNVHTDGTTTMVGLVTFTLKFEGTWWTGKDGKVHFSVNFGAVDPVTFSPLPSKVGDLVSQPLSPSLGCYFSGTISG